MWSEEVQVQVELRSMVANLIGERIRCNAVARRNSPVEKVEDIISDWSMEVVLAQLEQSL